MDYVDLRDLEGKERKIWKEAIENDIGYDFDELSENEPTMIPESEWDNYAYDLIQELYDVPDFLDCYIDYEKWAGDLQMDYSSVEVERITYYFRSY